MAEAAADYSAATPVNQSFQHFTNLLTNGNFNHDISGWLTDGVPSHPAVWSPLDVSGTNVSGSMLVTNQEANAGSGAVPAWQCVAVSAGATYSFGATVNLPPGQGANDWVSVGVIWFTDNNCQQFTTGGMTPIVSTPGAWIATSSQLTAQAGTHRATFNFEITKIEAGGSFKANVHNAFMFQQ